MYSTLKYRHWKIIGAVITAVGIGLTSFLGLATVKHINDGATYQRQHQVYEQQVNVNDMWRIIDGSATSASDVDSYELLAQRLSVVVDEAATSADITADSYSAPIRTYRGIEEEIGFNPFNSDFCDECGKLSQYMVERLRDIKDGHLSDLISEVGTGPVDNTGWGFTGLSFGIELIVVWQIFGALGMLWGLSRYGDTDLTWRYKDGEYTGLEWTCTALAPAFMAVFLATWNRRNNRRNEGLRQDMLRATGLAEILAKVEKTLKTIDEQPERIRDRRDVRNSRTKFEALRTQILDMPDEIRARQLGVYTDKAASEVTSEELAQDLLETAQRLYNDFLKSIEEVNALSFDP